MHPYEMFQTMMSRHDDRNVKVRPGTLYHQVGRLTELGYVAEHGTDRDGNRPERTTYAITSAGERVLRDQLRRMAAEPADEYPAFHLALAQVDNLGPDEAASTLESRVAALERQLLAYDDGLAEVTGKQLAERYWLDLSYVRATLVAQIEWLRTTIARIRSGDIPWDGPAVPEQTSSNSKEPTR